MTLVHRSIHSDLKIPATEGFHATYTGYIDETWAIGVIPHGGYLLALIIDATTKFQASTTNTDPIHVTAHYLNSGILDSNFNINLRVLKKGNLLTNILADFAQNGELRITAHLMFGRLGPPLPVTSYTRRLPLWRHPSAAPLRDDHYINKGSYKNDMDLSFEPEISRLNDANSPLRTTPATHGGGGLFWGGWYSLKSKEDKITPPMYAIFCDMILNRADHTSDGSIFDNWYPTTTMTLEFKSALPPTSAKRTVGVFTSGSYLLNHPNKRHNTCFELWSAPSDLGEGQEVDRWREQQVCLAVASQMAMIVPMEMNHRKVQNKAKL